MNEFAVQIEKGRRTLGRSQSDNPNPASSVFRTKDLAQIQKDIVETSRPVYSNGPPSGMGNPGQGKLKADQWKAAIEFELPVSLMKHWHIPLHRQSGLSSSVLRRHELAHNTILLASAIRVGTSYRTSELHRVKYTEYMHTYLADLLRLNPGLNLRPNHHNALHLGDFLLRFGPMHGWWMFPFERVIGLLQQVSTNYKQGEL